ncbi:MAG: efflux RND transporter permease subunit [Bacteriovoracaceae bacterium]|nr:efflux RND transporter permease subunit [Bacteriovoracaceae bacterium]
MRHIADFFIRNYKLTLVLMTFMGVIGIQGINRMNAESWPAVDFAIATITTQYKGAAPEDIEALITKPIEDEIRKVSGIKDVKSISQTGQSQIVVRVDMDNVDEVKAIDDLQKAVQRVSKLPADLEQQPEFIEIKSAEFPAIEIAVVGSGDDRLRDRVADLLKQEIEDISQVKDVRPSGYREREFTIELDMEKLEDYNIGVAEVLNKAMARNISTPGGDMKEPNKKFLVRLDAKVKTAEELSNLVIRSNFAGQIVRLKDVARAVDGAEEPRALATWNGEEAVLLIVNKKAGADTIKLADEVFAVVERYQKSHNEVKFQVYNNEANRVRAKLDTLNSNAISGLIIVLAALLVFIPGWVGIMASMSLPLAILTTLGIMPMFGMNLDSITILALIIAMGMLVDNSIVITDNFVELRRAGMQTHKALVKTVADLWAPITATAFTTIAAFLPMLVTKGIMGKFIMAIPIVVSIALVISLLESFFFLPMRLSFVGNRVKLTSQGGQDWFAPYRKKFENFMRWVVQHRYITVGGLLGMVVVSMAINGIFNKFMLFPAEHTEMYVARVEMPIGTPMEKTRDALTELSKKVMEVGTAEWVREIVGRAGTTKARPDDSKGGEGDNQGMLIIYATDEAKFNVEYTDFLKRLRDGIDTKSYGTVIFEEMVNGPPVGAAVSATFRSNDAKKAKEVIDQVMEVLGKTPGILDLKIEDVVDAEEVFVNLDYSLTDRLGVSVADIGTTVRTAMGGLFVSDVTLNNKEVNLNVKFQDSDRKNYQDLAHIPVMDRQGNLVPLGNLAKFETRPGTPQIKRFDYKRARTITASVDGVQMTSPKANAILKAKWDELQLKYPEVSLVQGGENESTAESLQSLFDAMVLAMIGIFALMVFMFRSFLMPFVIMLTIPLGLIGFFLSFSLHQRPVSFMALIGIIGLAGIIVNSGIVLIEFINVLRKEGKLPLEEILVQASGQRLRAVITTSITTVAGLFPTAYGIGGADAMLIPMTLAMAWGLTTGTIFTLVFIPAAVAIVEDWISFLLKLPFFKNFSKLGHEVEESTDDSTQEGWVQ